MKLRHFGSWAVVVALSLPVWAGERPGAISGYVRDVSGVPQIGAVIEIFGAAATVATVFTDSDGLYTASGLLPGSYSIKVYVPSFLPALKEKVGLHAGTHIFVDITLHNLLEGIRVGPLRGKGDDDDWKWTLRSVANRPVLRFDNPPAGVERQNHDLKATLTLLAGSAAEGYGSGSDMSTGFSVERFIFSSDRVGLSGSVGYGDSLPSAMLRAVYSHALPDGSGPSVALIMRRFAPSDPSLHYSALQELGLGTGDDFAIGDVLELKFGSELQTIQFLGHMTAFRPYGSIDLHASPNTLAEYDYTTSLPDLEAESSVDSGPAELGEADPRVSMVNFATRLERAHHQELSVSRRIGKNNFQVAVFSDRVANTALVGTGEVSAAGGFLLPDVYSGTFTYAGNTLHSHGVRLVLQRKLSSDLTATLDYACGDVLDLAKPDVELQDAGQWITTQHRQALAGKLSGTVHRSHTRWIASYRWVDGPALTPVDMFNASPGQSDPFLNLVVRQPIPTMGFLPAHMEALIDVRNLLAQGYVPVMGQDGQTVYLVQAARSVRGGVTITF